MCLNAPDCRFWDRERILWNLRYMFHGLLFISRSSDFQKEGDFPLSPLKLSDFVDY